MAKYNKKRVSHICSLLSKDSYTIAEICSISGISISTFYEWQESKPEFSEAVTHARKEFDETIVTEAKKSLRKLVNGYEVEEKTTVYVDSKDKDGSSKPKIKEQKITKKHYQPNPYSVEFVLTNKAQEEYKNRQSTEITGKGGKDLIPDGGLSGLTTDELKQLHTLLAKAGAKK